MDCSPAHTAGAEPRQEAAFTLTTGTRLVPRSELLSRLDGTLKWLRLTWTGGRSVIIYLEQGFIRATSPCLCCLICDLFFDDLSSVLI